MTYIDLAAFDRAPLQRDPYDFLILPNFILPDRFAGHRRRISRPSPAPARIRRPNSSSRAISSR